MYVRCIAYNVYVLLSNAEETTILTSHIYILTSMLARINHQVILID